MKTRPLIEDVGDGSPEGADIIVDWRVTPSLVMSEVDRVLEQYGFEVIEIATGGSEHMFNIKEITKRKSK